MSSNKKPDLVTVKRAAEITDMPSQKIIRLIRKKKLYAFKPDGGWSWLIPRSEIDKITHPSA